MTAANFGADASATLAVAVAAAQINSARATHRQIELIA